VHADRQIGLQQKANESIDGDRREHLQRRDAVPNGLLPHLTQLLHRLIIGNLIRQDAVQFPFGVSPDPAIDAPGVVPTLKRATHGVGLLLGDFEQRRTRTTERRAQRQRRGV
jgi:hypothetical protein